MAKQPGKPSVKRTNARKSATTRKTGAAPAARIDPRSILGDAAQLLQVRGLEPALAELDRVAGSARGKNAMPMAQRLLILARSAAAQHPQRALDVCQHILKTCDTPPVEVLLIAGALQDRLGDRTACEASMRAVVEAERAAPGEKLRAANLLVRFGEQELALNAAREAFDAMGRPLTQAATLLYIAQVTADWDLVDQLTAQLTAAYAQGEVATINETPRTHLLWCDDEATNIAVLKNWSARNLPPVSAQRPPVQPLQGRKIRLGYLSSDFREHPTARLVNGLLRHHDRSQFELFMYCSGWDDGSPMRREVESHFDHVHSVARLSDAEAAALIRSHAVDVLVELNGPTRANRMGVLAYRPAPVQIDYLGWPGSVGGRVVDYVVGDAITVPPGAEAAYPEQVIRLGKVYQVNDYAARTLPPKPTRAEVGLPDGNYLVLGMFNAINKVHNEVWDVWMTILKAVPNALLWILDPGPQARKLIAKAAQARGVSVRRIVAAPRLAEEQHLARLQHCDLMLDPWPYGGHTSTADALFAGVPVVALDGKNFASRVSGALLRAAGLSALVHQDRESYARFAAGLLRSPAALAKVKAFVREQVPKTDVFNARGKARQLEAAYREALERAGQAPSSIDASDQPLLPDRSRSSRVVYSTASLRGIPKIIHQSYRDFDALPPEIKENIDGLKASNPDWEYRYYDDTNARRFIVENYEEKYVQAWDSISLAYGAARADLFRYLLLYKCGGVWLDIKSSALRPLTDVINPDDSFILSYWKNGPDDHFRGWGVHSELSFSPRGEFQTWFIATAPKHPFLEAVIDQVMANISRYEQARDGFGKRAVLFTTGPIAYTKAIFPIKDMWPHREACAVDELGFIYSIYEKYNVRLHEKKLHDHYTKQVGPLIAKNSRLKAVRVKAVDEERLAPIQSLSVDGIRYRLRHQIGVGAFSTVYKAVDEWGQALAVKVFPPGTQDALWQNEAQQLRRFAGPGVVYLHKAFVHEQRAYLVCDDAGVPVSRCRFGTPAERLKLAVLVAKGVLPALARLHAAGHYHGDINPENVLVKPDAGQRLHTACLVDFGLCWPQSRLDAGQAVVANWTPPPEYLLKQPLNGAALDIWCMGVLLLQIITGKELDYSEAEILMDTPLHDARTLDLSIGTALSAALARDPSRRPDALGLWRGIRAAQAASSLPAQQEA